MGQPVRAGRAAIAAGVVAALYVSALFTVKTVPDWALGLFGGPDRPIDRLGGLTVTFRPAPGTEHAFDAYIAEHGKVVRRDHGMLLLEFPGLPEDAARDTMHLMTSGGLVMKEVIEADYATQIGEGEDVKLDVDQWRPDDGRLHTDPYLLAYSAEAMEQHLDAAFARGVQLPPGTEIAFEWVEPGPGAKDPRPSLRTYLVSTEVAIDGAMIAFAMRSYDVNTNRPIVLLDFTEAGGDKFCELTARIAGQKLATILGGRVESAPIINGRICGGRASITMGGSDPAQQEREANALVAVLATGALPAGGTVVDQAWKPAADVSTETWLARALFGLVAGIAFGALVLFVVRFARPVRAAAPAKAEGAFPWRRLAVTALAPLVMIVGSYVTLPGINDVELSHVMRREVGHGESVFALGIAPILAAFVLVELVALAVPRLRWRRHDPLGRVRLGQAVAVLGIGIALAQGYFMATYFESLSRAGVEVIILDPGMQARLFLMVSLAAGTMLLVVVAGLIREHGLGNGYAVLLVTGWLFAVARPYLLEDFLPGAQSFDRATLVGVVGAVAVALATRALLRWRVGGLRLPTSGLAPLSDSGGIVLLLVTLTSLGLGEALWDATNRAYRVLAGAPVNVVILVVSIALWSWLFARPRVTERVALQAGVERTTQAAWLRATVVTLVFAGGVGVLGIYTSRADQVAYAIMQPLSVMIATATLLDILDDARARRRALVPAGVVHQPQYLGVLERVLAEAGIPAHFHASHIRTLFAFFGPWAPIVVLVPEEHAPAARDKVDGVLRAARHEVAPAVARDVRPTPERRSAPASDQTT